MVFACGWPYHHLLARPPSIPSLLTRTGKPAGLPGRNVEPEDIKMTPPSGPFNAKGFLLILQPSFRKFVIIQVFCIRS
jgi:hypothetical protein